MNIEIEEAELEKGKERIEKNIAAFEKQRAEFSEHMQLFVTHVGVTKEKERTIQTAMEQLQEYAQELQCCVQKMDMARRKYLEAEEQIKSMMWDMKRIG